MKKDDNVYVIHIIEAANKILKYVEGMSENDFLQDDKTKDAVVKQFEVIGEAAKKFSAEFKSKHQHIDFKNMAGMRDILIHDYTGIDYFIVWRTVKLLLQKTYSDLKIILEETK